MNTKEQIIDFIETADEADLCVLAAITMGESTLFNSTCSSLLKRQRKWQLTNSAKNSKN